jgi:phospholipid transport system substrate-binding protein
VEAEMKNSNRLLRSMVISLAIFCLDTADIAYAEQPLEQVKKTVARVADLLQQPGANSSGRKVETAETIRQLLLPRFDFGEMAKRSLGSHWQKLDGRQKEFVSAFTNFVENSYMNTLESYKGEKIVYLRERVEQNFAEVNTQIVPAKGEPISVDYRLHLVEGEWKIYDVVVDHVSLVNNYRSQFSRILANASFDELLKKLREKGSEKPV